MHRQFDIRQRLETELQHHQLQQDQHLASLLQGRGAHRASGKQRHLVNGDRATGKSSSHSSSSSHQPLHPTMPRLSPQKEIPGMESASDLPDHSDESSDDSLSDIDSG